MELLTTLLLAWLKSCVFESLDCQTATEQRLSQLLWNKLGLHYASIVGHFILAIFYYYSNYIIYFIFTVLLFVVVSFRLCLSETVKYVSIKFYYILLV